MIFFIDSISGDESRYRAHAMRISDAPPFDVGDGDGFSLWHVSRPPQAIKYRSGGFDGIVSTELPQAVSVKRRIYEMAGAFGELILDSGGNALFAPLFLSSRADSSPTQLDLEVSLEIENLLGLPDVRRGIAFLRGLAGQCGAAYGGEAGLESEVAELEQYARTEAPGSGLAVPFQVAEVAQGALQLLNQVGARTFRSVAYVEDSAEIIRAGSLVCGRLL